MKKNYTKFIQVFSIVTVSIFVCGMSALAINGYIPMVVNGSYAGDYVIATGSATSTFGKDFILLNQDSTEDQGTFYVDISGNVSASGTLHVHTMTSGTANASACYDETTKEVTYNSGDGCTPSLRELKDDIKDLDINTNKVMSLEPVKFNWKDGGEKGIGLVAEDAERIIPELAVYGAEGDLFGVDYSKLSVILLDMVQKQQREIDMLKKLISKKSLNYCPLYRL